MRYNALLNYTVIIMWLKPVLIQVYIHTGKSGQACSEMCSLAGKTGHSFPGYCKKISNIVMFCTKHKLSLICTTRETLSNRLSLTDKGVLGLL